MRTYDHRAFTAERLAATRERTISVCLPARDEAATIGPILERIVPLRERGVIDQVVVADHSTDATAEIARGLGAEVHRQADLMPGFGEVLGKGDAMWRALSVLTGEIVCFVDADSEQFGEHYVLGLVGPLATGAHVQFVKGFYERPWRDGGRVAPRGGGRVTELLARPLLARFFGELAGFHQPLAGEIAARRDLLTGLPFTTGYGVDVALLIDVWRAVGGDALAQVDLAVRQNRHRPLDDLGPMAEEVLGAIATRLERDGRLTAAGAGEAAVERPPLRQVEAPARDGGHTPRSGAGTPLHWL